MRKTKLLSPHLGLEDHEEMSTIMVVCFFTWATQVLSTINATEPFPLDLFHTKITQDPTMIYLPKVCYAESDSTINPLVL